MNLTSTEASVLVKVLQGETVNAAPVSNNIRALVAAISGAANYPGEISLETKTLVLAFQGDLTVNPASENGRAIVSALKGHDSRSWPISNNVRTVITEILVEAASPPAPSFESGTNAQKLGGAWSVGTEFHVTDGFVVSGTATDDGFYYNDGGTTNGRSTYTSPSAPTGGQITWDTAKWTNSNAEDFGGGANPWTTHVSATLTHPAVQTRIAASTAQGGVAVIGGTQDGVFKDNGQTYNGRVVFQLLADAGSGNPENGDSILVFWANSNTWSLRATDTNVYYSASDVATPDLASNWLNATDDTPASITVTSVSLGEIYAGLRVTNDGSTNGSSYVSQPFHGRQYYMGLNGGGSNNMHWDTDFNVWTDDVGAWTTSNVVFPWQGADNGGGHTGATFAKNDVANEASWQNS